MTGRERAIRAMNLIKPDRTPLGFWFHFNGADAMGEACVNAHLRYYNSARVDIVKMMCDGYFDYPNRALKRAENAGDLYNMKPLGANSPFILEQVQRAKMVKKGLNRELLTLYNVFAPFSYLRFGAGDDVVMSYIRADRDAVGYALNVIAQDAKLLCEALITEAGLDGVYYCLQGAEQNRFTPEQYRRLITPGDLMVIEHANRFGDLNILHMCGWAGVPNHLEVWRDYPAKAVNWATHIEALPLAEGFKYFGGRCVLGGFDNRKTGVLYSGTRDEVRAETLNILREANMPGLMLGADCTLPANIDVERINWIADSAL